MCPAKTVPDPAADPSEGRCSLRFRALSQRMAPLRGLLAALLFLALWEGLAQAVSGSFLIAGPSAIIAYLTNNFALIARAFAATLSSAAQGFIWGNLAAILMAGIAILSVRGERVISAVALVVFCLPIVATGPILRILYGPGAGPQITLAALSVYYSTYLVLLVGLRAVQQSWGQMMQTYGRGPIATLIHVRARASWPYLFAGLQISAPAAFLGAMVGEFTGAERGLGVLTLRAMRSLDVDATWAISTVAAGASILTYVALGRLAQRMVTQDVAPRLNARCPDMDRPPGRQAAFLLGMTLLILILWHGAMELADLDRFFAKRPGDVWSYLTSDAAARTTLLAALGETLSLTAIGYGAGLAAGALLACAICLVPALGGALIPVAVALRSIPIVTTAPLIVLAMGRGITGTATVVAVMIFFPTFVACAEGLRQTPGQIRQVFLSYGAGRWPFLIRAQIPSMLPAFFASARMAVPAALLAVTTTEWLATGRGVGNLMALTASTSNYSMLWSCVAALALVAVVAYLAVARVERYVLSIYASEQTDP